MENTNSFVFTAEEIYDFIKSSVKNEETITDKQFFISQIYKSLEIIERELENEGEKYNE